MNNRASITSILEDASKWLHAAYDRPPRTPESEAMLLCVDGAVAMLQASGPDEEVPEGCTVADALMLRAANHNLAAEVDGLRVVLSNLLSQVEDFTEKHGEADFETRAAKIALSEMVPNESR
jgi:hypothetical protein